MKKVYLTLSFLGAVIPYWFFWDHFKNVGFGLGNFAQALFANGAAGGFSADVLLSSLVFWIFIYSNDSKVRLRWPFIVLNLAVGLSCALPLYFYFKEKNAGQ